MVDKWSRIRESGPDISNDRVGEGEGITKHYGTHDQEVSIPSEDESSRQSEEQEE